MLKVIYFTSKTRLLKKRSSFALLLLVWIVLMYPVIVRADNDAVRLPQTYAIIVGISDYEDPAITKLKFAHRDATIFAQYLRSEQGGNVPDKNIVLLQNEKASWSAVYTAMDLISDQCQPGDRVFFYFSGHGDVENEKIYKLGFLIAYNTPRVNYINSAVRLEDLNNFASTLSTQKNVEVIIITDACHSGNLSGNDFKGSTLVAEQLKSIIKNEVRLTSCKPDELSMENEQWGGGRSVFSYYLVEGLKGLAEQNQDGRIDLGEMDSFLTSSLQKDPVLQREAVKQTPVVSGKQDFKLGAIRVTPAGSDSLKNAWLAGLDTLSALPIQQNDAFFKFLQKGNKEEVEKMLQMIPFDRISEMDVKEIPLALVGSCLNYFRSRSEGIRQDLEKLSDNLAANKNAVDRFTKQLVIVFSNYTQAVITAYQQGDEAELEKRRYYNSIQNSYKTYADMLAVAMKCSDAGRRIQSNLLTQQHYFKALSNRLATYTSTSRDSLLHAAENELQEAIKIEEYAAYLYQELGLVKLFQDKLDEAEQNFELAEQIAPRWSIPKTYIAATKILHQDYTLAEQKINEALAIQPEQNTALLHAGMLQEELKNYLLAEEYFNLVTQQNSRHYLPFERLAFIKMKCGAYTLADSLFYEAENRKQGFNFNTPFASPHENSGNFQNSNSEYPDCYLPDSIKTKDVIMLFCKGMNLLNSKDTNGAIHLFKTCLQLDSNMPLVHYYFALIFRSKGEWLLANYYLNLARKTYLADSALKVYARKQIGFMEQPNFADCLVERFKNFSYTPLEANYVMADVLTQLKRYDQAAAIYREHINHKTSMFAPYYLLSRLQESQQQWLLAEETIFSYYRNNGVGDLDPVTSNRLYPYEREAFYMRVLKQKPNDAFWLYRAGRLEAKLSPRLEVDVWNLDLKTPEEKAQDRRFKISDSTSLEATTTITDVVRQEVPGIHVRIQPSNVPDNMMARAVLHLDAFAQRSSDIAMASEAYQTIGDLYVNKMATVTAVSYYNKALRLTENNADIRLKLIRCYQDNQQVYQTWLQHDTLFQQQLLDINDWISYIHGSVLAGKSSQAEACFERYKQLDVNKQTAFFQEAAFLAMMTEDDQSAMMQYKELIKRLPDNPDIDLMLADLYIRNNKKEEAYRYLQEALRKGFKGYWVLKYNPYWKEEMKSARYRNLVKPIQPNPFQPN